VNQPCIVYGDETRSVIDFPGMEMAVRVAGPEKSLPEMAVRVKLSECCPVPPGSEMLALMSRVPVGIDPATQMPQVLSQDPAKPKAKSRKTRTWPPEALSVGLPTPYARLYYPSYESFPGAEVLMPKPYAPVGWHKGKLVTTAIRLDSDERHDSQHFEEDVINEKMHEMIDKFESNRLVQYLGNCAAEYDCLTAQNFFMSRWEAPLPLSPDCNARCIGCPNFQENPTVVQALLSRLNFLPTADEVAEVAIYHLSRAANAVVSFGQPCEGEPLLQAGLIADVILKIRKATKRGTINLNTNGSLPGTVGLLRDCGLDSLRVTLNSARPKYYHAYFRYQNQSIRALPVSASTSNPKIDLTTAQTPTYNNNNNSSNANNSTPTTPVSSIVTNAQQTDIQDADSSDWFSKIKKSLIVMKERGGFTSLNYLTMPGFTDEVEEFDALCALIDETQPDLLQWKSLCVDMEYYLAQIQYQPPSPSPTSPLPPSTGDNALPLAHKMGIGPMIEALRKRFPKMKIGTFNPCLDPNATNYNMLAK
jgi:pyruvate-formate lyase-activating enzyme